MCICFQRVPDFGEHGGTLLFRTFEIKRYIKRYVKMSCRQVCHSIGAQLGNMEVICLPRLLERKGKNIKVPLLDPEDIKIVSLGAIWNFGKGTGLL
jgi:hypothetical protein